MKKIINKDDRKRFHVLVIPTILSIVWFIGAILSVKGEYIFDKIYTVNILYNLFILGGIFLIEIIFTFFDISVLHNKKPYSNRIVMLFCSILSCLLVSGIATVCYMDNSSSWWLLVFLVATCVLKFLCFRFQNNITEYFSKNNKTQNTYRPAPVYR